MSKTKLSLRIPVLFLLFALLLLPCFRAEATPFQGADGKYKVPIEKLMKMGKEFYPDDVIVEKLGDLYYMTFTVLDTGAIAEMRPDFDTEDKIGTQIRDEGVKRHYTYTLTEEEIMKDITFHALVKQMGMEVTFSIRLHLDQAEKLADSIDERGERPGRYVPNLETPAGSGEVEKGTYYTVEPGKATLHGRELPVTVTAYYRRGDEKVDVPIQDGRIRLDNVGEYHVVYRAESDLYKTNLGNSTFSQIDVVLFSKIGAQSYGKIELPENSDALPKGFAVQANLAKEDSPLYLTAKEKIGDYAENFEVISVTVYREDGSVVTPKGKVSLYLKANSYFDRNKVEVYLMKDSGELEKIPAVGAGRYVKCETDEVGNFLVCVEGVTFHMPMWGYAVITGAGAVILIGGIITGVILVRRHLKKRKEEI